MFGGSSEYDDFETVNFLFAKEDSAPKLLLESHALVLEYQLITIEPDPTSFITQFKTNKHLFSVVENDDNQDKFLDKKDKVNLLASDHQGANLMTIAEDIDDYEIAAEEDTSKYDKELIQQKIAALPIDYKEPLLLQLIGGFTAEEIAVQLDLNKNTVLTRLFRAKNLLKTNLKVEIENNGEAHG